MISAYPAVTAERSASWGVAWRTAARLSGSARGEAGAWSPTVHSSRPRNGSLGRPDRNAAECLPEGTPGGGRGTDWLLGSLAETARLGLAEPEIHAQRSKLRAREGECRPRLGPPARGAVEASQAEVAPGFERPHLERPGEGQRLLVALVRGVTRGGLPRRERLGLRAQRPRLVPTLPALARLLDCLIGPHRRIGETAREDRHLGQPGEAPRLTGGLARLLCLVDRLVQ